MLKICRTLFKYLDKKLLFWPTSAYHTHLELWSTLTFSLLYRLYVEEQLGHKYVEKRTIPFDESYKETGPATPVFFVLSPGVDPLKDVEAVGRKLGFTLDQGNFHNVSLGQVIIRLFACLFTDVLVLLIHVHMESFWCTVIVPFKICALELRYISQLFSMYVYTIDQVSVCVVMEVFVHMYM